jgi:hypothetical protein
VLTEPRRTYLEPRRGCSTVTWVSVSELQMREGPLLLFKPPIHSAL